MLLFPWELRLATFAVGWLCGALGAALSLAHDRLLGTEWTIVFVLLPAVGLLVAALYKWARGWRLPDMGNGARAEEAVGQAIEYALTRERCAVVHHVEEIAKVGDIDHLVATPRGLWVIETKHGRVPSSNCRRPYGESHSTSRPFGIGRRAYR